jgi:hypothetical protein
MEGVIIASLLAVAAILRMLPMAVSVGSLVRSQDVAAVSHVALRGEEIRRGHANPLVLWSHGDPLWRRLVTVQTLQAVHRCCL